MTSLNYYSYILFISEPRVLWQSLHTLAILHVVTRLCGEVLMQNTRWTERNNKFSSWHREGNPRPSSSEVFASSEGSNLDEKCEMSARARVWTWISFHFLSRVPSCASTNPLPQGPSAMFTLCAFPPALFAWAIWFRIALFSQHFFTTFDVNVEDLLLLCLMSAGARPPGVCYWSRRQAQGCLQAVLTNTGQSSRSFCGTVISTAGLGRKLLPLHPVSRQLGWHIFTTALLSWTLSALQVITTVEVPITEHCCGLALRDGRKLSF